MKRRHFLQFSSSLLVSLGMSQWDLILQANRYAQVLAQSTPRKLALLVGINDYEAALTPLKGCTTDVEMQRELLINRFGFNKDDIITLTNTQATREGILTAFEEHLIKQAKPGDVVIFHYSGHGWRVLDPNPIGGDKFNSTMVPIDKPQSGNPLPGIMGQTLFLLMSAIATENLTVVLDCCYSGGGKRGSLVVRSASVPSNVTPEASPEEFEYQKRWLQQLNLSKEEFIERRAKGVAKGVVIASAKRDQYAADAPFGDFYAGAFTYLLTRYLWQETGNSSLETVFVNLGRRTKDLARTAHVEQDPEVEVKPGSDLKSQPLYLLEKPRPAAEAVIRNVSGNQVEMWLGGVASQSLEAFKAGAIFSIIDDEGREQGQVEQESRKGLVGEGKVIKADQPGIVKPGTLLREQVRGIPPNLSLQVGVDETLDAQKAQVQTALQGQRRIEVIPGGTRSAVDYLLGRVIQEDIQVWQKQRIPNPPPVGSLGLFTAGRTPIPDSFGQVGESVETAMQRLRPTLKFLLAGRILQALANGDSSALNVSVSMKALDGGGASGAVSSRGSQNTRSPLPSGVSKRQKLQFKAGTNVQIEVQNNESRNLYISVLFISGSGEIAVLFPLDWNAPEDKALVAPKQAIAIPQPDDDFEFRLRQEVGTFELVVLASVGPLRNALRGLQTIASDRRASRGKPLALNEDEPANVLGNLLGDIDKNSRGTLVPISTAVQAVDTRQLAVISTVIEVVK